MIAPLTVLFLNLGSGEIFLIVIFILIFFGADKLPGMARTLGKGIREMKNATAEIQREIEKSATEVKRDMNLEEETSGIKEAADTFKKGIADGIKNLENHYSEKNAPAAEEIEKTPAEEPENPLTPPDAVKRA